MRVALNAISRQPDHASDVLDKAGLDALGGFVQEQQLWTRRECSGGTGVRALLAARSRRGFSFTVSTRAKIARSTGGSRADASINRQQHSWSKPI